MNAKHPGPEREPLGSRPVRQGEQDDGVGWEDRAAEARTADDPRARAPRDRRGVPSTVDRDRDYGSYHEL